MNIRIHKEPDTWVNEIAEDCIFCEEPTRMWSDDFQPVCELCALKHSSTRKPEPNHDYYYRG